VTNAVTAFRSRSRRRELALLARLADGSIREDERATLEHKAITSPDALQQLESQRRVVQTLRAGGPELPPDVRHLLVLAALERDLTPSRPRAFRPAIGVACIVAAAVIGLMASRLVGREGAVRPLTIQQAALLALRPSTGAPPPANPSDADVLRASFGGVTFPNYENGFHARPSGQRMDVADGREVRTVYYSLRPGQRVSYSVVAGPPLGSNLQAAHLTAAGVRLRVFSERGLNAVTLVRDGRTCVLAGGVAPRVLVALAAAPLLRVSG
jgi:hypothetical protein